MNIVSFKLGGQAVLWTSASDADHYKLTCGLTGLGLSAYIPEQATEIEALKMAVSKFNFQSHYTLNEKAVFDLEPQVGDAGYTLVARTGKGHGKGNAHSNLFIVYQGDNLQFYPGDAGIAPPQDLQSELESSYQQALKCIPSERITKSLTALAGQFGGVPWIKGRGRTPYLIPQKRVAEWEAVTRVFEDASNQGGIDFRPLNHIMDAAAVKTVTAAVAADLEQKLGRIEERLESSDSKTGKPLGRTGRRNMEKSARKLVSELKEYEDSLGVVLEQVREKFQPIADNLHCVEILNDLAG